MTKNLNPLYEIKTPLIGKTGSKLRQISSKLRRAVRNSTEGNKSKVYLRQYLERPALTRKQKAEIIKNIRKSGEIGRKTKQAIRRRNDRVLEYDWKYNRGWFEQNSP